MNFVLIVSLKSRRFQRILLLQIKLVLYWSWVQVRAALDFLCALTEYYSESTQSILPEILMLAKYHQVFNFIRGIGAQVKNTVMSKNGFLPQISDKAPTKGAHKKLKKPLMPTMIPFIRKVCSGNVSLRTVIIGEVKSPQAKNSRKITTRAWYTEASPMPGLVITPSAIFLEGGALQNWLNLFKNNIENGVSLYDREFIKIKKSLTNFPNQTNKSILLWEHKRAWSFILHYERQLTTAPVQNKQIQKLKKFWTLNWKKNPVKM